ALLRQIIENRLTAVLSAADADAAALLAAAKGAGVAVPDELSVISLGGTPPANVAVEVAQLRIPHRELGRQAVQALQSLLDGTAVAPLRITLDCQLDLDPTVGPAPPPA